MMRGLASYWNSTGLKLIHNFIDSATRRVQHGIEMEGGLKRQKRSTEGCSKFKSPETRQVQERLVSTLEHMQVPKWDRTRCPEE